MIRKFFKWVFKAEIQELQLQINNAKEQTERFNQYQRTIKSVLDGIDVSVDVHSSPRYYTPSWAVISLQGKKADYIKFIDLGDADLKEIRQFLRKFEGVRNMKIDATPENSMFLKMLR